MKEVFVFGAGASKDSGNLPLGSELIWYYHQDCFDLTILRNGIADNTRENARFRNYEKFLEFAGKVYPELAREADKWRTRGIYMYTPDFLYGAKKYYVDEMLERLQREGDLEGTELIRRLIFEHISETSQEAQNKLYEDFTINILKGKPINDVSVISFNFDFLLHEDFRNEVYFDYLLNFDWTDPHREAVYKKQNPIPLIKLNGSLDWGLCRKCHRKFLYFYNKNSCLYYRGQICPEGCDGILDPLIIMPYQGYRDIINVLWEKAKSELCQADKVTIIGYSFPEYDKIIIDLFRRSLRGNAILEVIDYCPSDKDKNNSIKQIKGKYKYLFPHLKDEPQIRLGGFGEYLRGARTNQ
jgi:hypothetical protein